MVFTFTVHFFYGLSYRGLNHESCIVHSYLSAATYTALNVHYYVRMYYMYETSAIAGIIDNILRNNYDIHFSTYCSLYKVRKT